MQYHVVPFTANIVRGQGGDAAAKQLADVINHYAQQNWEYVRLESVRTIIGATAGCMGFGATPAIETIVYMIVFRQR